VVPNGVDTARFRHRPQAEAVAELARTVPGFERLGAFFGGRRKVVLFAGNLVPVKGPDLLVRAFAALRETCDACLIVIGDGWMRRGLWRLCLALGIEKHVYLAGSRPHAELELWMNAADVLCLSSRSEGMPNVVLEAAACGTPMAAFDVGAVREMLGGEECARVVHAGSTAALAEALGALLGSRCDRAVMAARHGRRTWADQAREILTIMGQGETEPLAEAQRARRVR
jgi:glycosyltransferase involved in cell wall biosynthesis